FIDSDDSGIGNVTQLITDADDNAYQGFWGVANGVGGNPTTIDGGTAGTSEDITVINGFDITSDVLSFNVNAWAHGFNQGALREGDLDIVDGSNTGAQIIQGNSNSGNESTLLDEKAI